MKAIRYERFGGPDVLEYLDLPDPAPGPGQLLIQTGAIGVNFPDIRERLGVYNKAETRVGGVQLPQVGASRSRAPWSRRGRKPRCRWAGASLR